MGPGKCSLSYLPSPLLPTGPGFPPGPIARPLPPSEEGFLDHPHFPHTPLPYGLWVYRATDDCNRKVYAVFFTCFNGGFSCIDGVLVHYCSGYGCPICTDYPGTDRLLEIAVAVTYEVGFVSIPRTPSHSKWTKTGPSCDAYVFGYISHIYYWIMMKRLGSSIKNIASISSAAIGVTGEQDWHQVRGVRFRKTKDPPLYSWVGQKHHPCMWRHTCG